MQTSPANTAFSCRAARGIWLIDGPIRARIRPHCAEPEPTAPLLRLQPRRRLGLLRRVCRPESTEWLLVGWGQMEFGFGWVSSGLRGARRVLGRVEPECHRGRGLSAFDYSVCGAPTHGPVGQGDPATRTPAFQVCEGQSISQTQRIWSITSSATSWSRSWPLALG